MEKDLNEKLSKIEEEIKELPEKAQRAIYWIIKNFDFVEEMCQDSDMTNEEIEKYKENAIEKEDYIALALLCVAKMYRKRSSETMEQ